MATSNKSNPRYASIPLALLATLQMAGLAAAGPSSISGQWVGKGTVVLDTGAKEPVRCRVQYGRVAGQNFSLSARCATGSTRIDQSGEIKRIGRNRYVGSVHNKQFNVSARISITVAGARQTVAITSAQGRATMRLKRR
ncbi:MAG: hypothetical protein JXQ99_14970 [Hyphomicrobiaceae bacterium]